MNNPVITPLSSPAAIQVITANVTVRQSTTQVNVSKKESVVKVNTVSILTDNRLDFIAPIPLGGQRVVSITESGLAYSRTVSIDEVIGFTRVAVDANQKVSIQIKGVLNGFSNLQQGLPVYLADMGTITQTLPTTGVLQQLGVAIDSTSINIQIQTPIFLG